MPVRIRFRSPAQASFGEEVSGFVLAAREVSEADVVLDAHDVAYRRYLAESRRRAS